TGQITVPNTGGWQTFVTISVPGISLTSGQKVIRFYCDKGYFNTNYINVIRTGDMSLKQSVVKVGFYPNPVQNLLTLENNLLNADNAKIFNVLGELVSDVSIHQNIIDLSGLQSGVYGVTLINSQTKLRQNITILKK
ncbi:MAG TPA: T9SS type A sorting domain-containing protein, partial [Bacteroidales bacterium]